MSLLSFTLSHHVCINFLRVSGFIPNSQKTLGRYIGDTKLPIEGWVYLCVSGGLAYGSWVPDIYISQKRCIPASVHVFLK